jgi:hypothetical protein
MTGWGVGCVQWLGGSYGALLERTSAIRVCQPIPLARQRFRTSGGSRRLIATFGFSDFGRPTRLPARFSTARESISSVSSGSSLLALLEVRRVPANFSFIASPHRKYVASIATRHIANHDHATLEEADTQDALLAIVMPVVFHLQRKTLEDLRSALEIQATLFQSSSALCCVIGDTHAINVYTLRVICNRENSETSALPPNSQHQPRTRQATNLRMQI